jgi:hypothetical protein
MKKRSATLAALATLCLAGTVLAQNPRGAAVATVGGKKVSIDYGRPALKGRDLGALMKQLPADRIWRAGENQVTTFSTETALTIGGKKVPAGKYSLYVHVGDNHAWSLILNSDLGVPLGQIWDKAPDNMKNEPWPHLDDYTKAIGAKEIARAKMKAATAPAPVDLFTISLVPRGAGADLNLAWGKESWSVEVTPAK